MRAWLGLIRFSHTIFALPFAMLAMVLAWSTPLPGNASSLTYPEFRAWDVVGILLCMVAARSSAMAFNRWADWKIDAANPRTASRHIPAGILTRNEVLRFIVLSGTAFIGATCFFLPNRIPLIGSVPVLSFLFGYSYAKRFTSAAHLWLGAALALSPLCVWVAIRGESTLLQLSDWIVPGLLAGVVAFWVAGFDVIYACQDAEFDAQTGLHSVPSKFGIAGGLRIAATLHVVMLFLLVTLALLGHPAGIGFFFTIGVVFTLVMVLAQHAMVRPNDLSRVNDAFFKANATISVVLLVTGIVDCWSNR